MPAGIQPSTVWRVRPPADATSAGNDLNGGGYDGTSYPGGTDYTVNATIQVFSWTNLATSAANSTTVTSATANFTAAMVGNCINLASGTNAIAGFYFITAFTNSTTVTVDRTPATAGAMSGGTGRLGGAFASIRTYWSTSKATNWKYVAGNTVYVRGSGSNNPTTADYTIDSSISAGVQGDQVNGPIRYVSENGRAMFSHAGLIWWSQAYIRIEGFKFIYGASPTWTDQGLLGSPPSPGVYFKDCIFDQQGNNYTHLLINGGAVVDCEFTSTSAGTTGTRPPLSCGTWANLISNCIFHNLTGPAVTLANADHFINNLVINNNGDGVTLNHSARSDMMFLMAYNTIDGNAGHGINWGTSSPNSQEFAIFNNIITNHTTTGCFGMYSSAGTLAFHTAQLMMVDYNVYYNNAGHVSSNIPIGAHSTILSTSPGPYTSGYTRSGSPGFSSASNENVAVDTTVKGIGWPGVFKNSISGKTVVTSYPDPGAVQRQETSGGTGLNLTSPEIYYVP